MSKTYVTNEHMKPSKLAAAIMVTALLAFSAAPFWVIHIAKTEDGLQPYIVALALAVLAIWLMSRIVELFSTSLTPNDVSQVTWSMEGRWRILKHVIEWHDVESAVSDGRHIWIVAGLMPIKIDSASFWKAASVHKYVEERLKIVDVSIVRIDRRGSNPHVKKGAP